MGHDSRNDSDSVALIFSFDNPLIGVSARDRDLVTALERNTKLPKGPQGGVELRFAAVIARRGDIASEWDSHTVRLDDRGAELVGRRARTIVSPWQAFEEPIFGFEEPIFGLEEPIFGFGQPVTSRPIDFARVGNLPEAVGLVWQYNQSEQLDAGDFTLLLMVMPGDSVTFSVAPAAIPLTVGDSRATRTR